MVEEEINRENKCLYSYNIIYVWFGLYQETFLNASLIFVTIWCGMTILYFNQKDIQLVLLSIWWFKSLFAYFNSATHSLAHLQRNILSIQRMFFYCDKKNIERMYKSPQQKNPKYKNYFSNNKWPINGDINIKRLQLRYRDNFDIALDINKEINIKPGTKLAIVGRTGSGKSSIFVSIFRLFEPSKDSNVTIDKLNIYDLGLFDVRNSMSIIMQKPILFNSTLRFNLDPFNEYSDIDIWNALKDVQLFNIINTRENKLDCNVEANGSNFSVGEQQLICFARGLLKKSPIFFMDEPTSSIDRSTDNIIQKLIRSNKFKNTTVICIAHRLQTILDYDYILLLKNGKIAEYDTPNNLLDNKNSNFYDLVQINNLSYH